MLPLQVSKIHMCCMSADGKEIPQASEAERGQYVYNDVIHPAGVYWIVWFRGRLLPCCACVTGPLPWILEIAVSLLCGHCKRGHRVGRRFALLAKLAHPWLLTLPAMVYFSNIAALSRCPRADHGHQALAELLAGVIRTATSNVAAAGGPAAVLGGSSSSGSSSSGSGKAQQQEVQQQALLPPPMIPGNADQATTLCAMQVGSSQWREGRVGSGALLSAAAPCFHE